MSRVLPKTPNEQQYKFINFYAANGGNASKAYVDAGYKNDANVRMNAYSLLQRPYIQEALHKQLTLTNNHLKAKVLVNLDTMTDKVADLAFRCHEAGDRANELSCYQLLMRSRGLLTDNVNVGDTERIDAIDRKVLVDAKIIANIALPKLLDDSKVHKNIDNGAGVLNAVGGVSISNSNSSIMGSNTDNEGGANQQHRLTKNRCNDDTNSLTTSPEQQTQ